MVQLYEHSHTGQFRSTAPTLTSSFHTHAFALLPSHRILTVLSSPALPGLPGLIRVLPNSADFEIFKVLNTQKGLQAFQLAMKDFTKRGKEVLPVNEEME